MTRLRSGLGAFVLALAVILPAAGRAEDHEPVADERQLPAPADDGGDPSGDPAAHAQDAAPPAAPPPSAPPPRATAPTPPPAQSATPPQPNAGEGGAKVLGRSFPTPVQPPPPPDNPEVHVTIVPPSEPRVGRNRLRQGGDGGGSLGDGAAGGDQDGDAGSEGDGD
jgi:hypothetical protein